jgi:hypothetical protein
MGTTRTTSTRRLRLDAINEDPNTLSLSSSQQRSISGLQIIEPAVPQQSTTVNSVSPKDKSAPSASANAAAHSKHLLSILTATVAKPYQKFKRGLNKTDQYEYTPHGSQTKELGVSESARPYSSSTSSLNSSSSRPSDVVNAIESQSPLNANTATQETSRGEASKLNDVRTFVETSDSLLSSQQGSTSSNQSSEPNNPCAANEPAHDRESYMSTSPKLEDVVELYDTFNIESDGEAAINELKMALFQCNGTTRSKELAMFCLDKLLILTRKSEENKRVVISGGTDSALVAIIETARFHPSSVEIQQEVCGLLWALCVCVDLPALSTKFKEHVALDSGCKAILDAMSRHTKIDTLQVNAMKASKIFLFTIFANQHSAHKAEYQWLRILC